MGRRRQPRIEDPRGLTLNGGQKKEVTHASILGKLMSKLTGDGPRVALLRELVKAIQLKDPEEAPRILGLLMGESRDAEVLERLVKENARLKSEQDGFERIKRGYSAEIDRLSAESLRHLQDLKQKHAECVRLQGELAQAEELSDTIAKQLERQLALAEERGEPTKNGQLDALRLWFERKLGELSTRDEVARETFQEQVEQRQLLTETLAGINTELTGRYQERGALYGNMALASQAAQVGEPGAERRVDSIKEGIDKLRETIEKIEDEKRETEERLARLPADTTSLQAQLVTNAAILAHASDLQALIRRVLELSAIFSTNPDEWWASEEALVARETTHRETPTVVPTPAAATQSTPNVWPSSLLEAGKGQPLYVLLAQTAFDSLGKPERANARSNYKRYAQAGVDAAAFLTDHQPGSRIREDDLWEWLKQRLDAREVEYPYGPLKVNAQSIVNGLKEADLLNKKGCLKAADKIADRWARIMEDRRDTLQPSS